LNGIQRLSSGIVSTKNAAAKFFRPLLSLVEDKKQKPVYLIHPEGENCLKKKGPRRPSLYLLKPHASTRTTIKNNTGKFKTTPSRCLSLKSRHAITKILCGSSRKNPMPEPAQQSKDYHMHVP
jgi:hypothetical protein